MSTGHDDSDSRKDYMREYLKEYRQDYKNHRISVTLTPQEFARLNALARKQKKKPTSFLKELAFSALDGKAILSDELAQELQVFNRLIRNIANNVNQLARASNAFDAHIRPQDVLSELQRLDFLVNEFISTARK